MKSLILFSLLLTFPALADQPSTHGMLVFGQAKVFISHLPMFHNPHDYQLIAELELPAEALAVYKASLAAHPEETVYTLVPETFVLPEMVADPRPFSASLVRGHFERGGTEIVGEVKVKLGKVVHFRKFDPRATRPAQATYLLFGGPQESFVAHFISRKPDFDQIVELAGGFNGEPQVLESQATDLKPLPMGTHTFRANGNEGDSLLTLKKEIYLEHGDLSH